MRKIFTLLLGVLLVWVQATAQNRTLSGTVSDANGNPLSGVSVVAKPSGGGAVTDNNGGFSIRVTPAADHLSFLR